MTQKPEEVEIHTLASYIYAGIPDEISSVEIKHCLVISEYLLSQGYHRTPTPSNEDGRKLMTLNKTELYNLTIDIPPEDGRPTVMKIPKHWAEAVYANFGQPSKLIALDENELMEFLIKYDMKKYPLDYGIGKNGRIDCIEANKEIVREMCLTFGRPSIPSLEKLHKIADQAIGDKIGYYNDEEGLVDIIVEAIHSEAVHSLLLKGEA